MTSRERLLRAIDCKPVDRVPVSTYELCGYNSLSFENQEKSYKELMDKIRRDTDCVTMWNPQSNETLMQSSVPLNINVKEERSLNWTLCTKTVKIGQKELKQQLKTEENIVTVWQVKHWCEDSSDVDTLLSIEYEPLTFGFADYARVHKETAENGNGIIMATLADPMCIAAELMSFSDFTVWAMTEEAHFAKTLEKIYERMRKNYIGMFEAGTVDLYRIVGPEYCTPPYLPPGMFKKYVAPYVKDIVSLIHAYGKKARVHSHGRISRVLDDIISTGADALDPIEDIPDGDTLISDVKQKTAGKMCLFGNLQLKLLEQGTKQQIQDTVKYLMDSAKNGGGFVIMPTAAPINIPLSEKTKENYFTFIDTALEYGKY